jgi:dienelactone hydrolase
MAGSARRAAASAAAIIAVAGCGGSGSHNSSDALRGVKAHRLADEPSRNRARVGGLGAHRVAVRRLNVARDGIYGEWHTPADGRGRMPAVVAFGGSTGGLVAMPRFARAFASEGYPALALAYFKEPGLPQTLERIPLEYFARAIRWVARQPNVDPRKIVLLGISRGGEGALLIGATYPQLVHGVIAFVPSDEVNPGWTYRGRQVPPFRFIRVERIRGPILTASGGRDQVWSSSVYTEQIEQRLEDHHFRYSHERLDFPKAGHFLAGTAPVIWPRVLRLMRRLRAAPPGPARGS